jgi:hypothetical protein
MMDAAYCCCNGIHNWIVRSLEFVNAKIPWSFIKSKTDVDRNNFALQVCVMQRGKLDELML